ncbi:hypothetical protein CDG81_22870 [Actinopolyspora erythraea]|uniref:Uncharacterized protein n=1 Tax=Actinopolyspora erythraea TaxID=414996 RepID=A0A099DA32_9ACTN|nr:hypothetical protein [Actinopolyspora erythraea]ASU80635.1 hypothetical protein CDG81_22870 [Actinopolyspora erythraea]KGI82939.1 hypothetical protein IL38_01950 [Actinopolyspora erythraea]
MNVAIVMMGALLPILAASVFYVSDHRTTPHFNRSPTTDGELGERETSVSGGLVLDTSADSGVADRETSKAA